VTEPDNVLRTVYGDLNKSEVLEACVSYDRAKLLQRAEELRLLTEYLASDIGSRDAFARLYCVTTTVLCNGGLVLPPHGNSLRQVLSDVREDLDEALAFFHGCEALIEPLERLLVDEHAVGVAGQTHGTHGRRYRSEPSPQVEPAKTSM